MMQGAYRRPSGNDYALIAINSGFPIILTAFLGELCLILSDRGGARLIVLTMFQPMPIADCRYRIGEEYERIKF